MTPSPVDRLPKVGERPMDAVERVAKAIWPAVEEALDIAVANARGRSVRRDIDLIPIAQAAIDELNKMAEEEHGVPVFVEREKPKARN